MNEKKIVVPEGMMKAAKRYSRNPEDEFYLEVALGAAIRWLAENPIVPTKKEARAMYSEVRSLSVKNGTSNWADSFAGTYAVEWQRRMFLAPDADEPIKDLLAPKSPYEIENYVLTDSHNDNVREAYRRGKAERQ